MPESKSRWQKEFDALPEWAKNLVRGLAGCGGYGGINAESLPGGMPGHNEKYSGFHVLLSQEASEKWWDGFFTMKELAGALTAPWPPPQPPARERRAINVVELVADGEDCAFDQPCAFGHRVEFHAVYCHNDAWPDSPRKCKRGAGCARTYGIPEEDNRHEDCPGFVANPDYKPPSGS